MGKTVFRSAIGWVGYVCYAVAVFVLFIPFMAEFDWGVLIVCLGTAVFILVSLFGIWYEIDGRELVVYVFFRPTRLPVDKISEIRPVRSIVSGAALSTDRIAIRFDDRKILKSYAPLEISPVRRDEFIACLLEINQDIKVLS